MSLVGGIAALGGVVPVHILKIMSIRCSENFRGKRVCREDCAAPALHDLMASRSRYEGCKTSTPEASREEGREDVVELSMMRGNVDEEL